MNCSVTLKLDGKYRAIVRYRDDRETHDFDTEGEARRYCKRAEKVGNGNTVRKRDIPLYREVEVVKTLVQIVKA